MSIFILAVAIALGFSFVCSLLEATLLSLSPGQIAEIGRRRPRIGEIWGSFKRDIERPIAVILIVNTAAHTIGASLAGSEFTRLYGNSWVWVFSLVFTAVMVQFTEIFPKTFGVRFNHKVAVITGRPLRAAVWILSPLLSLIHWVNRPLQAKAGSSPAMPAVEEITALAGLAQLSRQISSRQERIITGASRLSGLTVGRIMIPVGQISFLSTAQNIADALVAAHIDAHTRFPICEDGDRDRIAGYVNFKELVYFMRMNPNESTLKGVVRPALFADPAMTVSALLEAFVKQRVHLAIVRDAGGRTLGLVTLEDIVEELVGDIEDEFDRLPHAIQVLRGGTWMAGGGAAMAEVVRQTGLGLSAGPETLSHWVSARLGRSPVPGDVVREAGAEFLVRRTRRANAFEVGIALRKEPERT